MLEPKLLDIDWNSGQMMVREGKDKKDHALWINPDILSLLQTWRARRSGDTEYLFTTSTGGQVNGRALRAMVKRRAIKAGLTKNVHPHTLRHSFATEMYRQTKDIRRVQKMLGHADLSTTMIYTHIGSDPTKVPNLPQHFEELLVSLTFIQKGNSQISLLQNANIWGDILDIVLRAENRLRWHDFEENIKKRLLRYKYDPL